MVPAGSAQNEDVESVAKVWAEESEESNCGRLWVGGCGELANMGKGRGWMSDWDMVAVGLWTMNAGLSKGSSPVLSGGACPGAVVRIGDAPFLEDESTAGGVGGCIASVRVRVRMERVNESAADRDT